MEHGYEVFYLATCGSEFRPIGSTALATISMPIFESKEDENMIEKCWAISKHAHSAGKRKINEAKCTKNHFSILKGRFISFVFSYIGFSLTIYFHVGMIFVWHTTVSNEQRKKGRQKEKEWEKTTPYSFLLVGTRTSRRPSSSHSATVPSVDGFDSFHLVGFSIFKNKKNVLMNDERSKSL